MSALAAVMPAPRAPLVVREVPLPALQPGEILLETLFSEVCGTDVHLWHGRLAGVPYPLIPGHVSVGRIVAMRGGVKDLDGVDFRDGDVVAFLDVHGSCGACHFCLVAKQTTRCPSRKVYGITFGAADGLCGGWATHLCLKAGTKLLRFPSGLDPETYIGGGCGLNTALHTVDRGTVRLGDDVVVLGVGPVGQSTIAFARISGAGQVIAIGAPDDRLAYARRMGATHTISLDTPAAARLEEVRGLTGGRGADVVLEVAGAPDAVVQGAALCRDGGTLVVAGQYTDHGAIPWNVHELLNKKHLDVRGCWGSDYSHFHRAIRLMGTHHERVPWREMITRRYDLAGTTDALRAVESRDVLKAVIVPR